MTRSVRETAFSIRQALASSFGARLQGVVVYGSVARGEARPDSDLDVIVLLDGPLGLWDDARAIASALFELELELGMTIHGIPVDAAAYEAQGFALYRLARKEGVAA